MPDTPMLYRGQLILVVSQPPHLSAIRSTNSVYRNPVVAGYVDTPEDFFSSSARKHAGRPGLLEALLID